MRRTREQVLEREQLVLDYIAKHGDPSYEKIAAYMRKVTGDQSMNRNKVAGILSRAIRRLERSRNRAA